MSERAERLTLEIVTSYDYHEVMKSVRIADLKARLSAYLRSVRRGETLTVLDRETPVARIVPIDQPAGKLSIRRAKGKRRFSDVPLPLISRTSIDIVSLLLEERQGGR